jgi:hypothetical protein
VHPIPPRSAHWLRWGAPARASGAALVLAAVLCWCVPRAAAQVPELRAGASLLLPGLGQALNGDYAEGGAQLGLYLVLANQYLRLLDAPDYIKSTERTDRDRNITINRTSFDADLYGTALTDLSLYSAYGAYRDARQLRGNQGYATPAPQETLGQAAAAPFQWEYLQRPTAWLPVLIALGAAVSPPTSDSYLYRPQGGLTRDEMAYGMAGEFEMVAVGEESFFRGVLNNGFSSAFGENWGLAASSAVFGLAHAGVGAQATPAAATIFGAYLGWLHQRNDYDIREGVAIHFWWDFLTGIAMLKTRKAQVGDPPVRLAEIAFHF